MARMMNMIIVARNITRRPILSDSQPPISAPTSAPPCVPAAASPSSSGSGWYCSRMNTSTKAIE